MLLIGALLAAIAWLDYQRLGDVVTIALSALTQTTIYIAIAVGLLAYLKASSGDAVVAQAFEGGETRMILVAAMVGGLAPFCSCEVIPFIAGLLALGAPLSAVMAFWLSSPLMDPPTLFITAGALGWDYAIAKTVAAVGLGLFGGFAVRSMQAGGAFASPLKSIPARGCGCGAPASATDKPEWRFWRDRGRIDIFRETAITQSVFLLRWLSFAYVLEALLITYAPAEMVTSVVGGDGVAPIIVSAFVGMPAYLNGYAAPPMVAGLVSQEMQPGAALAFLVAGAVSSIPAMAAVWSLVKPQVFAAYLTLGVAGAIASGVLFQNLVG